MVERPFAAVRPASASPPVAAPFAARAVAPAQPAAARRRAAAAGLEEESSRRPARLWGGCARAAAAASLLRAARGPLRRRALTGPRRAAGEEDLAAESDPAEQAAASDPAASSLSADASKWSSSDRPKGFRSPKGISGLLHNNRVWRKNILTRKPWYFEEMGKKHQPTYMWIGCADARVTADRLINVAQGEMFVARNIANVVDGNDTNLMSAVYYAVEVLEVEHIIVCGHYDCGGVKAALKNVDHRPPLENWLANIRDVHRLHAEELEAITDEDAKQRRLVELNVIESCMNLFKTGVVQRRRVATSKNPNFAYTQPALHAVVYDPSEGLLKQLPVDFGGLLRKYADIYNLYQKS